MILTMDGLRPSNLMTYLAALGLIRVTTTQFDPGAVCWWEGDGLRIETTRAGLEDFVVDEYRPSPILSPWNGGSGYGAKDKAPVDALNALLTAHSPRLAAFVATDRVIRSVRETSGDYDKAHFVQALRNRVPDEALPWLDASVVLARDSVKGGLKAVFPPLLGTGGNDGRFDFSTNFHQRLADVLPDLGAKRAASVQWLGSCLSGSSVALKPATVGQFDPLAAGGAGTSSLDSSVSFVNPWSFVLMMEGLLDLASSPVRRLGETSSRAAMPFTVYPSSAGPIAGSAEEEAAARGEFWAPVWSRPLGAREIGHVFSSAKASWNGATATGAAHMYAALRSNGIDRRVGRFVRFGLLQRNGLAFSAVLLDEVTAKTNGIVEIGIAIEDRVTPFRRVPSTNRLAPVLRTYEQARVRFYRDADEASLLNFLARATEVEREASLTDKGREDIGRVSMRHAPAGQVLERLATRFASSPELRVAAGIASASVTINGQLWTMRDLLFGRPPRSSSERWSTAVGQVSTRPLPDALADLLAWRMTHREDAGPKSAGAAAADRHGYRVAWQDLHRWVNQELREGVFDEALLAMLSVDWFRLPDERMARLEFPPTLPCPSLAILQPFAALCVSGEALTEGSHRGINPDWPRLLISGQTHRVLISAVEVLNRSLVTEWSPRDGKKVPKAFAVEASVPTVFPPGARLTAALWASTNHIAALRQTATVTSTDSELIINPTKENAS